MTVMGDAARDRLSDAGSIPARSIEKTAGFPRETAVFKQRHKERGISAAGSAPHWQCGGHGFESRMLHISETPVKSKALFKALILLGF